MTNDTTLTSPAPRYSPLSMRPSTALIPASLVTLVYVGFYLLSLLRGRQEFIEAYGVRGFDWSHVGGTLTYSFAHYGTFHLVLNMIPLFLLTAMICYIVGWREWMGVTILSLIFTGWFAFFTAERNEVIFGASGITSALGIFLLFTAVLHRNPFGLLLGAVYSGITIISLVTTMTAQDATASWHAHLGGLLIGFILFCALRYLDQRTPGSEGISPR